MILERLLLSIIPSLGPSPLLKITFCPKPYGIINISENIIAASRLNRFIGWREISELKSLFKGVVLCEKKFEWQVGSASNTDWIFRNLEERLEYVEDYQERKELYEFGFANRGDYPYVSANSGLRSTYENYEDYLKACIKAEIEKAKRSAQLFEIQKTSKELSAVKKEFKERDKEERMKERAERKKEKDKNISIIEF